jgi:SAM-dependent methyltransferase
MKIIQEILRKFGHSKSSNVEYNKKLWNRYASGWIKTGVRSEDPTASNQMINFLGDEWGKTPDVQRIIEEYIYPFITTESITGEIGSGGARIASKVVARTKEFYCFDISTQMLKKAREALAHYSHVHYFLLDQPEFPNIFLNNFDFLYAFDVFVHLDLHTMWKYFKEFNRVLKPGGKVFVHTTNLKTPDGWKRFSDQKEYRPENHYFISPEIVSILAERSHLKIIKASPIDSTNFYLSRDYLVVLQRAV